MTEKQEFETVEIQEENKLNWLNQNLMSILVIILMLVVGSLSVITLIKVNKLEDKVNEKMPRTLESTSEGDAEERKELDITTEAYYNNQLITEDNYDMTIEGMEEYLIYFHQDNCEYCLTANYELDKFIEAGYGSRNGKLPVLFATPKETKFLFDDLDVESTPEIIHVVGESMTRYNGSEKVIEFIKNKTTQLSLLPKPEGGQQ